MGKPLKFGTGQAIQFCSICLQLYGFPTLDQLERGIGAFQMVTVYKGNGLCQRHFEGILTFENKEKSND